MRRRTVTAALALLALVLGGALAQPPSVHAAEECFAETGFCIRGRFLDHWQQHGGLALNGYPLTGERRELLEDGKEYTIQYFERVRMEYHPESRAPDDVQLGVLGQRFCPPYQRERVQRGGSAEYPVLYFEETGHNITDTTRTGRAILTTTKFRQYWERNGGLRRFGYPITEQFEFKKPGSDRSYFAQYFERAIFDTSSEGSLLLPLGRMALDQAAQLKMIPEFFALYTANQAVREQLGYPLLVSSITRIEGALLAFEHGRILSLAPERGKQIESRSFHVLCGDDRMGRWARFNEYWWLSDPPGGGPGPQPGLYEPGGPFGKAWHRSPQMQQCLGYATSANERPLPLVVQPFQRGLLLLVDLTEGRFVYMLTYAPSPVVSGEYDSGNGHYERFPVPSR